LVLFSTSARSTLVELVLDVRSSAHRIHMSNGQSKPIAPNPSGYGASTKFLLDASLSLINRTGAHYLAEELCRALDVSDQVVIRRWRLVGKPLPPAFMRKVFGRLMLKELTLLPDTTRWLWPEPANLSLRRIFLDPLYVLRSRLGSSDIVLCHDIGPITHPHLYDVGTKEMYSAAYAKVVPVRPGIVFVSDASRGAFEANYGTQFRFMRVIPPLVRESTATGETKPVPGIVKPFFLTVGTLERRKNQAAAIRGFVESNLHARGFNYVLCGARGMGASEIDAMVKQTPGVQVLGYVSDAQLRWLYREATAFVLPSLLEGFGMPALEAARHGLIPILSRNSALTEAVGDHGIPVNPESPTEIADAMRYVAGLTPEQRTESSRALIEHASSATRDKFLLSWKILLADESGLA
jgi:glycosyltransferase involved in cell wall biosynthesis